MDPVRVADIDVRIIQPPFSLALARAVRGPYLLNGAEYLGLHTAPRDAKQFFLTGIVDETAPDRSDRKGKLMVQGGAQYGCPHSCPFCVYAALPFYRNLTLAEMTDLFRLALYLKQRTRSFEGDNRRLVLKFTDNGEPFENPALPHALDQLLALFGKPGKVLMLKISTILGDTEVARQTFEAVARWQEMNAGRASIHLQISHTPYRNSRSMPGEVTADIVRRWRDAIPWTRSVLHRGWFVAMTRNYSSNSFMRSLR